MEKRRINVLTIIIICIVTLIIGAGIGYFIYGMVNKPITPVSNENQNIKEKEENKNVIENVQSTIVNEDTVGKMKYDGTKQISVKSKNYKVSYASEEFEHFNNNELKQTEVKLYLNDEKVKTLNLGYLMDVNHEFGNKDYGVELYNFCDEYILIVVKHKFNDGISQIVNHVKFCVVNTDGEHIDTLEWQDTTQIWSEKDKKQLTYEINNDNIIVYEASYSGESGRAIKRKYTVIRDIMRKELLDIYDENEVSLAGK